MNVGRSWVFFIVMLVLAACAILLLAETPITESWDTLRGAPGGDAWEIVGTGSGKVAAAAGWRGGELTVRWFSTDGARLSERRVPLPDEMTGGTIVRLLPVRDGLAYVGLYGPNAQRLYLCRIDADREPERLLALDCGGDSSMERAGRTALSELTNEDGVISFAVQTGGPLERYICRESGGLEAVGTDSATGDGALSILSTPDGALLLGGTGTLSLNGNRAGAALGGQTVTHLTQGRGGWYYIDAARLEVCFVDAALSASYRVLRLNTELDGTERSLTSAALTRDETALLLLDGTVLTLTDAAGTRELTGILRPTALRAGLSLAKYALFAVAAAAVLWLLLCGLRRGYAPLVVFRGGIFVAAALLCFTVLRFAWIIPMQREAALRDNEVLVSGVLRAAHAEDRLGDGKLAYDVCGMLEGTGAERGRNVRVLAAELTEDGWTTADGSLAAASDAFDPALTEAAQEASPACEIRGGAFRYTLAADGRSLSIRVEDPYVPDDAYVYKPLLTGFAALALLALVILFTVGLDVRRISGKMERISRGGVPEQLNLRTGDELESMASIMNSLGVSMKKQEEERERVEHSYRRFVPEKVLALLGKKTIQEVDKSAFAARRMAVMTVWFSFPDALYTDMRNSRLLFDSVNEVIERTASIVARKGGTVFHFAYNGFDVVMDEGGEAVSTAVAMQQEVLSFNETRMQNGLPRVTLRIALDKGNVMLGIVGDTSQMEPTTISSSLSTVQELIELCNRLKAGILCTEAIISERQEYGNRYMGKCTVGSQSVRVYEVFDGDEFSVRRGKSSSLRDFSKGVYDLYGGDAAGAKHMFLKLAHNYPLDGGARYYLYLADRLEHDPSLPCVLNVDNAAGEEM